MAVYFLEEIGADGKTVRVKIGYTDSARGLKRLIEHENTHAPNTIKQSLYLGDGTREDEKKLHGRFAKYRLKGTGGTEWFEPADEILDFIKDRQVGEAPKEKKKSPAMPKPDIRISADIFTVLQGFSTDKLKRLFREVLRYNSDDTPVEIVKWQSDHARDFVAGNPTIVATYGKNDAFKVVHARLKNDRRIVPAEERAVSSQLLKEYPYGLYVFSNASDSIWHFVNVRYEGQEDSTARKVFHSFPIEEGESLRTLSERLSIFSVNYPEIPAQELQRICDFAFDVEEVTQKFFQEYKRLYEKTKEALNELIDNDPKVGTEFKDSGLTIVDAKTKATVIGDILPQKILSQIVLLYFVQKKGWLGVEKGQDWGTGPKDFLRRLFDKDYIDWSNFYNDALEVLFYEALARPNDYDFHSGLNCKVPFLNGGLFTSPYDWVNTDVKLPDDLFSNNEHTKEGYEGTGILDVFDRFNFTVKEDEPLEKEVAVDPEMLGKVFESLLESERRKKTGTFYTTREVVHYVCQEALVLYLENELKLPEQDIRALLNHEFEPEEALPQSIVSNAESFDAALRDVRIIDPAVGSGAFPVGAMTEIVRMRTLLTPFVTDKHNRNQYDLKRHVIQENIYGVDIEAVSTEVAKLRMWLSLVVDEDDPKKIKPLPNLDYKVVCGDSLPSGQLLNQTLLDELEKLEDLNFAETNRWKKDEYRKRISELVQEITEGSPDIEVYFSKIFRDPSKKGFDIVIGNPPWGLRVDESLKESYGLGSRDSYGVFMAKAVAKLLKPNGVLGFIVHDTWLTIKSHRKLREKILGGSLRQVIRFNEDCFTGAAYIGKPGVFIWQKTPSLGNSVLVADLTNISTKKEVIELKDKLNGLEDLVGQSTDKFAVYRYPQELIKTNSNLPVFVGSPKLFVLMNDTTSKKEWEEVGGKKVQVRQIGLNGKTMELVRFGDIADVKQGLATGDNDAYLFQKQEARGHYRSVKDYKDFVLTDEDLEKIRSNELTRSKVVDEGIHKTNSEPDFDIDRYFDGRYIVAYDKGGESDTSSGWLPNYYVPTDYFIDWSVEAVSRMKTLTMAERDKDEGRNQDRDDICSRFQNADSYFRNGITFSSRGVYSPSYRVSSAGPFDKESSCFFTQLELTLVLGLLGSKSTRYIFRNYCQHTVSTDIDSLKEIPIPIAPCPQIEKLVSEIIEKQKKNPRYDYASNEQKKIDKLVYEMYGLDKDDIKEVETWYRRRYPRLVKVLETEASE